MRSFAEVTPAQRSLAAAQARAVADRAGVRRATAADLQRFSTEALRTSYRFDVRTPQEFSAGHVPGFASAPGGQLVQETDMVAPVRGARLLLADDDGVRANMSASWLAQMGWEVLVLDGLQPGDFSETGSGATALPEPEGEIAWVSPQQLAQSLEQEAGGQIGVLDLGSSAHYVQGHVPGAWWGLRSELAAGLARLACAQRLVLSCNDGLLAPYAAAEVARLSGKPVSVLQGGKLAWSASDLSLEIGETRLASARSDRYRRPYEGTDNPREAMQGYLDWEYGLVRQLEQDGTHGFFVI
jgi:rhodanese-related sulfurtransferase